MQLQQLQRARRLLAPGVAAIAGFLWIVDQIFNFRELLRMNVPTWFWSVVFASIFFVTIVGALIVQNREIEHMKQQPQVVSARTAMQTKERADRRSQEQAAGASPDHQEQPEALVTTKPDPRDAVRTAINDYLLQARDMRASLNKKNEYSISSTLKDHIREWGVSVHQYFRNAIPGRASAFVDELPQLHDAYGRYRLAYRKEYAQYLDARIAELESLRKEWNL